MVKKACAWAGVLVFVSIQALPTTLRAGQAPSGPTSSTSGLVAEATQRIEFDRLEVRVTQGKQTVQLGSFLELFVVTPVAGQTIENLAGRSVAIVPTGKRRDRWEVYDPAPEQMLPENVFNVKQVFISSRRRPVEIKLDGHGESDSYLFQLKSGDALLVL